MVGANGLAEGDREPADEPAVARGGEVNGAAPGAAGGMTEGAGVVVPGKGGDTGIPGVVPGRTVVPGVPGVVGNVVVPGAPGRPGLASEPGAGASGDGAMGAGRDGAAGGAGAGAAGGGAWAAAGPPSRAPRSMVIWADLIGISNSTDTTCGVAQAFPVNFRPPASTLRAPVGAQFECCSDGADSLIGWTPQFRRKP